MKIFALIMFSLLLVLGAKAESTTQRDAPTVRFYDSRGNSTGSASTYGSQTRVYDSRGNLTGTITNNRGRR